MYRVWSDASISAGRCGIGWVVDDGEVPVEIGYQALEQGPMESHAGETRALAEGLRCASEHTEGPIRILVDDETLPDRVPDDLFEPTSGPMYELCRELLRFDSYEIYTVPREDNRMADSLASMAIEADITGVAGDTLVRS